MLHNSHLFTVFHGTNLFCAKIIQYYGINLNAQRDLTDFGKGFYVTPNLTQAKEWSCVKAQNPQINSTMLEIIGFNKNDYLNHPETKIPAYLTFNLNLSRLLQLNGLLFPMPYEPRWHEYKKHWKAFVHNCRIGLKHSFDFIYGPVGGRHNGSFFQVKPTKLKEQLSLNSLDAIQCLSNLRITILSPKSMKHIEAKNNHNEMRKTNNNLEINHPYLKEILEVLLNIGYRSHQNAIELINNSWVANQIDKQDSIIGHEPPEYWAFFILYESKKLWYQDYETYLKRHRNKNI